MITFFTIVLDGMPWITRHLPEFRKLPFPWRWIVVEGVAQNVHCTSWCAKLEGRLSSDGTREYLDSLHDSRMTVLHARLWPGKVAMCNAAVERITEPCLLWQVDADELWTAPKIKKVAQLFDELPHYNAAYFDCRYFVGPDVVTEGVNCYGNNREYEWLRVWRYQPGMRFERHEPPRISGLTLNAMPHELTHKAGCVFDHMAYATPQQVQFKARYYAGSSNPNAVHYQRAMEGWSKLQTNQHWPVRLKDFLPWVDDKVTAVRI